MPEAIAEKQVCEKCGAGVRENTVFCYACGERVEPPSVVDPADEIAGNGTKEEADPDTQAALNDLAERFKIDEEEDGRLAKAAAERKKARVSNRKTVQYVWEPDDSPNHLFLVLAVVIAIIAAVAVLLTVWWR